MEPIITVVAVTGCALAAVAIVLVIRLAKQHNLSLSTFEQSAKDEVAKVEAAMKAELDKMQQALQAAAAKVKAKAK